jgi:tape measure domain-containing protein
MANDGFIEFLSPNALAELKKASEIVDALALKIEKISNFKAPTTPGGVNSASKQIIDDLKAQEAQLKAINAELIREEKLKQQVLATETKQANATKANIAQREAQRKASLAQQQSDEKAARAAERSALANQRLNDAYGQLNKRRNEAARTLQNLIASETASNAEIRKAQREFDILNGKVKKADQAVGNFSRNVGNYKSALSGVSQLMSAFGISTGVFLAVDIAKSIFNTTKELQSLDMALRNVSGTQLIYQENMNFLSKVSEDFGIEIKGLQEQFTQFYVAAKDKLSAEQIRDIFKSISKAGAAMGLSVEAQNSAFLALQQMMSKGTVQAEELKKQLGNALPGAFNIMATALGVTEKKMMEMMKAGDILSEVALPKFAKALEKAYGIQNVERIDTIIAAQERLSNSWTNLIRGITEGDGVINKVLIKTLNLWTYSLNGVIYATNVLSQATKKLFGIEENDKIKKSKAVKQAISDYEEMQSALKKANEEREKEVVRLNKLQKIQGNVTESEKTKAQFEASISEEKIRKLDILIEKETKLLNIKKVDTVKKLNEEIAALQARNAETSLFSLEAIRKRLNLKYKSLAEAINGLESPLDIANEKMKEFLDNATFETINKGLEDLGISSAKIFLDLDINGQSTFDKLLEGAKTFEEQMALTFQVVGDIYQDISNKMFEESNKRFENQKANLEKEKEIALAFAGDSDTAKAEIERQAEERRKQIARREFKAKKEQAIFNIAIDTAQAIMSTYAKLGFPAGVPLALIMGALGLAQVALVNSQQIPAYKEGTENHSGGMMLVNDGSGSNYKETIQTPDGKIYQPKERNVIMNAPKGTKVFTHDQWKNNLDNILTSNSINYSQPNVVVNSGMSDLQVDRIVSTIANKQEAILNIDKNGWNTSIRNGHTTKQILNNQVTFGR